MAELYKVSTESNPNQVAAALAGALKEGAETITMRAVGAGAVNQAVKAVAIARGYVAPNGLNLSVVPGFVEIEIGGEERTAMELKVVAE